MAGVVGGVVVGSISQSHTSVSGPAAGLAAVVLAQRIAAGEDTGAGIAAMVKQLGATMADALRGVAVEGDPLDELRARRAAKETATAADA